MAALDSSTETDIEVILIDFGYFDESSDSGSDDANELYSKELTTTDEIQSWMLGFVPFKSPETLRRELKVYQLVVSSDPTVSGLSEDVLQRVFETGDFSALRPHALNRLHQMIEYYGPKYFTSFMNTDIEQAEFIIGLTDDGEVTGAIVPADLTQSDVWDMVWCRIEQTIRSQLPHFGNDEVIEHYVHYIRQNVKVNMVEMDSDVSLLDDWTDEFMRAQSIRIAEYQQLRRAYMEKMMKFSHIMQYYRRGVAEMINDPDVYDEFTEFIRTHVPNIDGDVTSNLRQTLIDRVRRSVTEPVSYARGQISDEKYDVRNLAYWITQFRDIRVDALRDVRPQVPMVCAQPTPLYTSMMIRNPVHRLVSGIANDPTMKVVVIQIIFPGRKLIPFPPGRSYHRAMSYIDTSGTHKTSVRYMNSNGPSCARV